MRLATFLARLILLASIVSCASSTTLSDGAAEPRGRGNGTGGESSASGPLVPLLRDSRAANESERRMIDELVQMTSEVRGIEPIRPIETRIASSATIASHLVSNVEEEDLVELVDLYVALSMLEPGTDVVALLSDVVGEQVVGFYDPKLDLLVIRDDIMTGFARTGHLDPEALITIAHEIIHALQGQRLSLRERMEADLEIDVADAYQALVEGDATLGMVMVAAHIRRAPIDAALALLPNDVDFAAGLDGPESDALAGAPPIVRIGMTAPYIAGLSFCAHLFRHGGTAAIDGAHAHMPQSTEQVMHPEKYLAGESPDVIDLGPLAELESAGYARTVEHTLGELELGIYLGRGTTHGYDPVAGSGWGGDRVRIFRHEGSLAAVLVASFDTETDAIEAERAASRPGLANPAQIARFGRVLVATHGIASGSLEPVHARARAIAEALPARSR